MQRQQSCDGKKERRSAVYVEMESGAGQMNQSGKKESGDDE